MPTASLPDAAIGKAGPTPISHATPRRARFAHGSCRGCDNRAVIKDVFEDILDEIVAACGHVYAEHLDGVVVFGSVARGTMRADSDIDLLVVVESLPDGRIPRMDDFDEVEAAVSHAMAAAADLGVTTRISPIVRTLDECRSGGFLLYDIACDGRVLVDRVGAVDALLSEVRDRIRKRGARRETRGRRYWVLEPDLEPGDVVVL